MRPWASDKINRFRKAFPEVSLVIADKKYLKEIGCDLTAIIRGGNKPTFRCPVCSKQFYKRKHAQKVCSQQCGHKLRSALAQKASAKLLSLIRRLKRNGRSKTEIARILNAAGRLTPRGKRWTPGNVQNFFVHWQQFPAKLNRRKI